MLCPFGRYLGCDAYALAKGAGVPKGAPGRFRTLTIEARMWSAFSKHAGPRSLANCCFVYGPNEWPRHGGDLFVGSGVVEAGCKTVIGSRVKQ
jgi:hypothetical protein